MELFGTLPTGEMIYKFTLKSESTTATVMSYGATITSFKPFGKEIIAGFDSLEKYVIFNSYFGTTVGRVCNRIVGGAITVDGVRYELARNNGEHCLHGGLEGYHNKPWEIVSHSDDELTLSYLSYDGESGFPGEVRIYAIFKLIGDALAVQYRATTTKKTPIMLTSHGFFNLSGFSGDVLTHRARIYADKCTAIDEKRLPTGEHSDIRGSFLDFTEMHEIGDRIDESPVAYDHNYILSPKSYLDMLGTRVGLAAEVEYGELKLSTYTDQPGMQFYVMMRVSPRAPLLTGDIPLLPFGAFCLESQIEPDCVSRGIGFVDVGEEYLSTTVYSVSRID